jgi:hypothetical protein
VVTQEYLKSIVNYDPQTGVMNWIVSLSARTRVGDVAGNDNGLGYLRVRINKRLYVVHRLAWLYMTGLWPEADIDHINMNRSDNRWENLRQATRTENFGNRRKYKNNTSGVKGAYWSKSKHKYVAGIGVNGRDIYLGLFDCPAAASFAYQIAADQHFGEFARIA